MSIQQRQLERPKSLTQFWLNTFGWPRSPTSRLGSILCLGLLAFAITAPILVPINPNIVADYSHRLLAPSFTHPLGTDGLGREVWKLVWQGIQLSMGISLASVGIGCSIGLVLGITSGYWRGIWESCINWLTDVLLAFPPILLAIAVATLLGPGLSSILIAISVVQIPVYTRLSKSLTLSLSAQPFVLAAKGVGASPGRIMTRHILPASLGPLAVQAALSTGSATLEAAGLGFLGLGAQPPTPELGTLMADAFKNGYSLSSPWTMIAPGLMITIMVLAFNLMGDGLRDSFDPNS